MAKSKGIPPYAIFQESSIEEMAIKYPVSINELKNIIGVGEGKAIKFGGSFVILINEYVEENNIVRPDDLIVKTSPYSFLRVDSSDIRSRAGEINES